MIEQSAAIHAETRRRILRAAETFFFAQGFSKVTMGEIAAELGMSKKTIYQHFAGKEELLLAVIDRFFDEVRAALDAILADDCLAWPEKVRRCLAFLGRKVGRFQSSSLQDIKRTAPRGWERADALRREIIVSRLGRLVREGAAAGMVRPDLNPDLLVFVLLSLVDRVGTPDTLAHLAVSPADLFHHLTSVFFEGILTDSARTMNGAG